MTNLEIKIKDASQRYYSDGSSPYTDEQFDKMVEQLKEENPDSELLKGIGFGYDINKDSTPGKKYAHKYSKIGGLDKAYSWDEIPKDIRTTPRLYASAKLDGLSVVLYYTNGILTQALTRGQNNIGIDITNKVISIIGDTIAYKWFTGGIRGEIIMTDDKFNKFLETHKDEIEDTKVKNPRNCAAGLINAKEISDDLKFLDIIVYSITGIEYTSNYAQNYICNGLVDGFYSCQSLLTDNFKMVAPYKNLSDTPLIETSYMEILSNLKNQFSEMYPVDGVVLTSDVRFLHHPENKHTSIVFNQIAFKFESEKVNSKVIDVEWNYTKTRYMMPKVNIETVQLAGTNVSYATGYNAKYILDNNIGIGSIVEVEKHGEIIPNINKVIKSTECELPDVCPYCNSKLVWNGVHLQCPNKECEGATSEDLLCWLRNIAPVDGLGDILRYKLIKSLYSNSLLKVPVTIEKVMNDLERYEQIIVVSGKCTGQKKLLIEMLTKLTDNSKIPLNVAIKALNIPRFGDVNSYKLAMYPELVKDLHCVSVGTYSSPDIRYRSNSLIGEANTTSIYNNLDKFKRLGLIIKRIDWDSTPKVPTEYKGIVCVTGKLSVKRDQFEKELNAAGYKLGELTKSTSMLITDNPDSNSSKNQKADKLGIPKITEAEFRAKYMVAVVGVDLANGPDYTNFGGNK